MKLSIQTGIIAILCLFSCKNSEDKNSIDKDAVNVIPISHGTLVLEYKDDVIYVDPVGGKTAFTGQKPATLILITDIHGDHLNTDTLDALKAQDIKTIVPQAVYERLSDDLKANAVVMNNGDTKTVNKTITIEAIPMYNLREEALEFHTKGRGNGYILTLSDERIYISGDTEDIPEMRALKNIDKAFVCMNLPWTMPVESAANAVVAFKPDVVYPYHYRGTDGLSDVLKFKELVQAGNSNIDVRLLNWYPSR